MLPLHSPPVGNNSEDSAPPRWLFRDTHEGQKTFERTGSITESVRSARKTLREQVDGVACTMRELLCRKQGQLNHNKPFKEERSTLWSAARHKLTDAVEQFEKKLQTARKTFENELRLHQEQTKFNSQCWQQLEKQSQAFKNSFEQMSDSDLMRFDIDGTIESAGEEMSKWRNESLAEFNVKYKILREEKEGSQVQERYLEALDSSIQRGDETLKEVKSQIQEKYSISLL